MERRIAAGPKSEVSARKHFAQESDSVDEVDTICQINTGGLTTAQAIAKYKLTSKLETNGPIAVTRTVNTEAQLCCVKWMEEFDYLATGNINGEITFYNPENMEVVYKLMDNDTINAAVTCIKHRPVSKDHPITNNIICTYSNGFVKYWNYKFNQCLFSIKEKRETNGVAFHIRLPKFVTFGSDARVYLYDEETRTQERVFTPSEKSGIKDGHEAAVHAACFNPRSNNELVTGGADGYVLYWDIRQQNAIKCLTGLNILGEGLDINPKGIEILTCSMQKDNPLQIFEYDTGNFLKSIHPDKFPKCQQRCGKYISKDCCVTGGDDPNLFRLIDMKSYESLAYLSGLPNPVLALDIGQDLQDKSIVKKRVFTGLPTIAFCCGQSLYEVNFTF